MSEYQTFEDLAEYYNNHPDFNFYYYDGTEPPKRIEDLSTLKYEITSLHGVKDGTDEFRESFIDIMMDRKRATVYQREQPIVQAEFELWINPTIDQLHDYNEMEGLDFKENLETFKGYSGLIQDEIKLILQRELLDQDYLLLTKSEIIQSLLEDYIDYVDDDEKPETIEEIEERLFKNVEIKPLLNNNPYVFEKWIEPVNLNDLEDNKKYIVNSEISFKPIEFDQTFIDERYGQQNIEVSPSDMERYLKHIFITDKGIEYTEKSESNSVSFYSFDDLNDYLSIEELESFNAAHEKIAQHVYDVSLPFIEVAVGDKEYYKSTSELKTERDILDYVNSVFSKEGLNLEAKTFDRHSIWKEKELEEKMNRDEDER